ncbi:hypothetical protein Tco_0756425 [Tanacetum coccineum]
MPNRLIYYCIAGTIVSSAGYNTDDMWKSHALLSSDHSDMKTLKEEVEKRVSYGEHGKRKKQIRARKIGALLIPFLDQFLSLLVCTLTIDVSSSGLKEFQQPEFEGYGPKISKSVNADTSNEVRKSHDTLLIEKLVSDDKSEKKTIFPTVAKIEFVRPKQQEKPVRKIVKYAEMYRLKLMLIVKITWKVMLIEKITSEVNVD